MNCHEIKHKLPDYIDQLLDRQEVANVKSHLKVCKDCQKEYRLYKLARQAVANLSQYSPSVNFNRNVLSALGLEYRTSIFPIWTKWAAGLASLALMWAGGIIIGLLVAVIRIGLPQTYLYLKNPQKILTAMQFVLVKTWFVLSDIINNVQALVGWFLKGSNLPLQAGLSFLIATGVVMLAMRKMRYQVQH
jgi:predicted anti-sigma-YlaC factor YlaD